jgi:hypothetical protein
MAVDPEAQAQIARLLEGESLRVAPEDALRAAIDTNFERLIDGIVAEAAASDDVFDRDSGVEFVQKRVEYLSSALNDEQQARLLEGVRGKIEAW